MLGNITIYFVRHAQTSGNVEMRTQEEMEDMLTDLGRIQTNLLGMHLSSVKFDRAFSSDYTRAVQTANGILNQSRASSGLNIEKSKQLREINLGMYENKPYKEILSYAMTLTEPIHRWSFPRGESFPEAGQRLLHFVEDLCTKVWDGDSEMSSTGALSTSPTFLVVSHSGILSFFVNALLDNSRHKIVGLERKDVKVMNNACYFRVEITRSPEEDVQLPETSYCLRFKFVEPYSSHHLTCLKGLRNIPMNGKGMTNNPLIEFAQKNRNDNGSELSRCVQQ